MKKNANKSLPFFERQLNSGQKLKMEGVGGRGWGEGGRLGGDTWNQKSGDAISIFPVLF